MHCALSGRACLGLDGAVPPATGAGWKPGFCTTDAAVVVVTALSSHITWNSFGSGVAIEPLVQVVSSDRVLHDS